MIEFKFEEVFDVLVPEHDALEVVSLEVPSVSLVEVLDRGGKRVIYQKIYTYQHFFMP